MTLFELQAWLGHGSPATTQRYAKLTSLTLAKPNTDAGYFADVQDELCFPFIRLFGDQRNAGDR